MNYLLVCTIQVHFADSGCILHRGQHFAEPVSFGYEIGQGLQWTRHPKTTQDIPSYVKISGEHLFLFWDIFSIQGCKRISQESPEISERAKLIHGIETMYSYPWDNLGISLDESHHECTYLRLGFPDETRSPSNCEAAGQT